MPPHLELLALTMHLSQHIAVLFFWLCFALIGGGHGQPWRWGPASNSGPIGGPAWNGGHDESTDNIVLHANGNGNRGNSGGNWRY